MTSNEKGNEPRTRRTTLSQLGILFVAVILISGSLGYLIGAVDGPSGFGTVIEPGGMVEDASFIIFKDGSTYYAKNGTTGAIDYSDSNLTSIFDSVIDANPDGGTIRFKQSEYTLSYDLVLDVDNIALVADPGVTIIAEFGAEVTIPILVTGNNCTIRGFKFDGNNPVTTGISPMIELRGDGNTFEGNILTNCKFYGVQFYNATNGKCINNIISKCQYGIAISGVGSLQTYTRGVIVQGNIISDCNDVAIKLRWCSSVVVSSNIIDINDVSWGDDNGGGIFCYHGDGPCIDVTIHENMVQDSGKVGTGMGIAVTGDATGFAEGIAILGNNVRDCYYGINVGWNNLTIQGNMIHGRSTGHSGIYSTAQDNQISSNSIHDTGIYCYQDVSGTVLDGNTIQGGNQYFRVDGDGIGIATQSYTVSDVVIKNNILANIDDYGVNIYFTAGWIYPDNTIIEGNVFENCTTGAILNAGTNTSIKYNVGYVTENKGTATITTTTFVTFAHSLATTPTLVLASFNLASYGNYTWTATTTEITITVSTSGTYTVYWYAEV